MLNRDTVEKEVLGGMLYCSSAVADFMQKAFQPDIFQKREHRTICEAIIRATEEGIERPHKMSIALHARLSPDTYSIVEGLKPCPKIDLAIKYLYDLNISEQAKKISEKLSTVESGTEAMDVIDFFRDYSEDMIDRCREADGKTEYIDRYSESILSGDSAKRISTPFTELNARLGGGFAPGDFVLIGGTPGAGKTTLMLSLALHAAKQNERCTMIEAEMTSNQLLFRLNGMHTGIPISQLRDSSNYKTNVLPFLSFMHELPFEPVIDSERTPKSLEAHMSRAVRDGSKIIFVDYLQIFKERNSKANDEFYEIKKISERLRRFALKHSIVVVAASSLNRNESAKDKPGLQSLYGTSQLGHDAGIALVVYAERVNDAEEIQNNRRDIKLAIIKARDAGRGEIALTFTLDCQRIEQTFGTNELPTIRYSNVDF